MTLFTDDFDASIIQLTGTNEQQKKLRQTLLKQKMKGVPEEMDQ